jgi:glycosyltransferase involved in cell wall biosynthesis
LNILHVNSTDIGGGAARAAYRIHRSLVENGLAHGLTSQMRVISQLSDDPTVISGPPAGQSPIWRRLQPHLAQQRRRGFRTGNPTLHSLAWPSTGLGAELQQRHHQGQADLVHLHWLGDGTLSIEEIGLLPMPLVWTLHDQWAFCGAEHYTSPPQHGETASSDERFTKCYTPASRPSHEAGPDINRRTWLRKHLSWRQPIHIVCPSNWLADCARRSSLMGNLPIMAIPYPINLNVWSPCNQLHARALLGLPSDRKLVLFGAIGGTSDYRKGSDLLFEALSQLSIRVNDGELEQLDLVVFGQGQPASIPRLGFRIHYAGILHDDLSLRLLYSAADVMVVPSRQEAFGQTASEAHACGCPVVGFRTGGLIDIVDDRITGALAEPFEPQSLATSIFWILHDKNRLQQLRSEARSRAERLWSEQSVACQYFNIYDAALLA